MKALKNCLKHQELYIPDWWPGYGNKVLEIV